VKRGTYGGDRPDGLNRRPAVDGYLGERRAERILRQVDSVRSREPSPFGIAYGDSVLLVPNEQDQDDRFVEEIHS